MIERYFQTHILPVKEQRQRGQQTNYLGWSKRFKRKLITVMYILPLNHCEIARSIILFLFHFMTATRLFCTKSLFLCRTLIRMLFFVLTWNRCIAFNVDTFSAKKKLFVMLLLSKDISFSWKCLYFPSDRIRMAWCNLCLSNVLLFLQTRKTIINDLWKYFCSIYFCYLHWDFVALMTVGT